MNDKKLTREKLALNRQQEIIRACEELYETLDYEEINIKEIAKSTSICRSNIYNYYETKEEIFLDILSKEYCRWMEDMDRLMEADAQHSRESYCRIVTDTVENRPRLLRLLSVHHTTIEKNCSLAKITAFKRSLEPFQKGMRRRLAEYFPGAPEEKKERFLLILLSLAQGIYSMTNLSPRQLEAMRQLHPEYRQPDFASCFYEALYTLASGLAPQD